MSLPKITIKFENGLLGTVAESADGLVALAISATSTEKFELGTPYEVFSIEDVKNLGITKDNNSLLYSAVSDFYNEAEEGTKVVLYGFSPSYSLTTIGNYEEAQKGYLRHLITAMNGKLRAIFVSGAADDGKTLTDALPVMQKLSEWATTSLYAPLFVVIDCKVEDNIADMSDLSLLKYNRVGVMVGDTAKNSTHASVGTLAGRIAEIPVQRSIGRVKDGALYPTTMYIGADKVEDAQSKVELLHDKGYIVPRKHIGRSGYFFADDYLACVKTDDYASIPNRRIIDKAYRLVYDTLLDEMLDELELNSDGTMQSAVVKYIQQKIENAINRNMTANGELSSVAGSGCKCFIDDKQNVVVTSKLEVSIKVRPFGYARDIDVKLGFLVEAAN